MFSDYDFGDLAALESPFNAHVLADRNSLFLIYASPGMTALKGSLKELNNKTFRIKWFDPLSGNYFESGTRTFGSGPWHSIGMEESLDSPFSVAILELAE